MSPSSSSLFQLGSVKVALLRHRVGTCCAVRSSIWLLITRWRVRSPKCFMSVNKGCTNLLPSQLLEQVCVFLGKQCVMGAVQKQTNFIGVTVDLHKNCSLICAFYFCLGRAGLSSAKVADEMLDAIVEFARQKSVQHLQTIKIVIFQTNMLRDFYESMKKREDLDSSTTESESWLSMFKCKLFSVCMGK